MQFGRFHWLSHMGYEPLYEYSKCVNDLLGVILFLFWSNFYNLGAFFKKTIIPLVLVE